MKRQWAFNIGLADIVKDTLHCNGDERNFNFDISSKMFILLLNIILRAYQIKFKTCCRLIKHLTFKQYLSTDSYTCKYKKQPHTVMCKLKYYKFDCVHVCLCFDISLLI